ncbi:MAG TPA: hypothetical protein VGM27_20070 [Acidobacteriaceae bacterium]
MTSDHNSISRRAMMTQFGAGITGIAMTSSLSAESQMSGSGTAAPFVDPTAKYPKPHTT